MIFGSFYLLRCGIASEFQTTGMEDAQVGFHHDTHVVHLILMRVEVLTGANTTEFFARPKNATYRSLRSQIQRSQQG